MGLAPADAAFAKGLTETLGEGILSQAEPRYLEEPRGRYAGQSALLARPRNTQDVSRIVTACAAAHVAVLPYGGGTGLVGGQVAPDGPAPVILSLERMRQVRGVYPRENIMIVEAGATLAEVQQAAREVDRLFPLSLASEGTARIGGCLSTNAGGVNVLRYGNARDLCLGLEAVLPDGTIWHGTKRLRKDNSGYDLKHLLMGAEGTLGVITAASLRLSPIPAEQGTALFSVPGPEAALDLLALARDQLGEGVSAFELIHRQGFDFLGAVGPDIAMPFETLPDWMVLIELGLPKGLDPQDALAHLFATAEAKGLTADGVIAQSQAQRDAFWHIRESIPEANRRIGAVSSHDISVPMETIPTFITRGGEALAAIGDFRINCFGHVGDGNLHYNVFPQPGRSRADHENSRDAIKRALHDIVHDLGGSVSAEHGIGRLKVADLERYGDPAKLAAMRAIKAALDPAGIMNPGAVLA
ncbi:FAD-binding oxidoreductase [Primorskyibacter sp. S187A]|uniref:FAD-binding oxidoreductase n=1 Tax=Primorskyibacter sp. S187A TaxID=3415130 RepID=UPI003C7CF0C6